MDDTEDDGRYPPSHHRSLNHFSNLGSSSRRAKLPTRAASYPRLVRPRFGGAEVEDDEEIMQDEDDLEEYDESNGYDDDGDEFADNREGYDGIVESDDSERYRRKRKLENLNGGYEFAPRAVQSTEIEDKPSSSDWSEEETFFLLEAWGDKFLQSGRRSLRADEWKEVAERVGEMMKTGRTELQCRSRFDVLKKKYRKEKDRLEKAGGNAIASKWAYFKRMDVLLMASSPSSPEHGLACGIDSGEYVFTNPKVYLRHSNGFDEMRDSPGSSNSSGSHGHGHREDDSDGLPPRRRMGRYSAAGGDSSFRLLADSIHKFGEIYEKIENSKRQQMMELEKMRIDFHQELELQKKRMLEKAQAEIVKMQQEDEEEEDDDGDDAGTDVSAGNLSG